MKNDEQQDGLTREDYQRQKQAENEQFEKRDRKRVQVERDYARTHAEVEPDEQEEPTVRSTAERKSRNLGKKLNWIIFGLIVAIIVVYLILFFVK
ncbi:hypothetical protein NVV78_02940 [Pediococcus ethanolidurans]|uniref:hypothetical protein n=1 Tax=Pediococcus ethanolidurans TaxID=319653 RepID=UPI0021E6FEF3|nr:hypothetical protein [Pediococcus ethanolidurans]MCV3314907.1 hypothetical protein [Pediococcus ethanolidurans]